MNKKICLMFSGQGSQKTTMGESLAHCSKSAKKIFDCASEVLHYDVLNLCTNKTELQKLHQTKFAQPAIVAVSIAAFKALIENPFDFEFKAVVGHSLGSISALAASKIVSIPDCFKIVKARAEAMQQCETDQDGSMCAILGATVDDIKSACENANDYVTCANFNGLNQIVISGKTTAVTEVVHALKNKARRCVMLNVKAAFHSELMKKAVKPFEKAIELINFSTPIVSVFSNVTGKKINKNSNIKKLLVEQIISPVLFTQNLLELEKEGFNVFIELGPGKTLCSMVKTTIKRAQTFNVCDEKSLNETLKSLKKST